MAATSIEWCLRVMNRSQRNIMAKKLAKKAGLERERRQPTKRKDDRVHWLKRTWKRGDGGSWRRERNYRTHPNWRPS